MKYAMIYMASFAFGAVGAWSVAKYGSRLELLDRSNDRSSHEGLVPKGGGVGILAAFFVSCVVLSVPNLFWIPLVLVSLFSFWGDRSEIRPKIRLLIQFAAGILFLIGILLEKQSTELAYALAPLLVIFFVGTANYYNFMDGINGIAGVTGIVAFGLLAWFAVVEGADLRVIKLCICLCFACLGFLPFNMPKARVFMGDVGSILLGFVFAGIVVWLSKSFLDFVCGAAFLFPFYADELSTMAIRIGDGENLLRPHRRHLYQLLANELKIRHWKISVGYGFVQLLIGASILAIKHLGIFAVLSIIIIYFAGFVWVSYFVRRKIKAMGKDYKAVYSFHA